MQRVALKGITYLLVYQVYEWETTMTMIGYIEHRKSDEFFKKSKLNYSLWPLFEMSHDAIH